MEDLSHFGGAANFLLAQRLEQTLERALHVLQEFVDHAVAADFDADRIGEFAGAVFGHHLEADDDGVGSLGQRDVGLGDGADGRVQ